MQKRIEPIRRVSGVALAALAISFAQPAVAGECSDLAGMAVTDGKVTSASLVAAGGFSLAQGSAGGPPPGVAAGSFANLPAFCRTQVTLKPSSDSDIKVEVWLPASGWNGKLVGIGNGIWAGSISYFQLADPLSKGYAVVATDSGHVGNGLTAEWAIGHPEKLVDFGYRAVHGMTVAAKESIRAFYGQGPRLSLWNSCSTGGRQGLMAAFRYPEDYDAISAMAPANPMTNLMTQSMWAGWQPQRMPGAALGPAKLGVVHAAVVRQCDKLDGLEDGIVMNPTACAFDPKSLQCAAGDEASCLTAPQVETMQAIYAGVSGPDGRVLLPGFPVGSEMQLAALTSAPQPFPVALTYFSMLVFGDQKGWDWKSFDYSRDLLAGRAFGADMLDVSPTGLDAFFARGGKLLLSHGWNDGLIPADNTLNFYRELYHDIPLNQAQDQLRFYIVPGMDHCSGGEGVSQFDTLGVIDNWASTGQAPHTIVASRGTGGGPNAPARPALSRPLCPYPLVARYEGAGDTALASSFRCTAPS